VRSGAAERTPAAAILLPVPGTIVLHRPARMLPPPVPSEDVAVMSPPSTPPASGYTWWPQLLFPLVTVLGSAYFVVYNPNPTYIAISVTMALASVALSAAIVIQQLSAGRKRSAHDRVRYLAYLDRLTAEARQTARRQRTAARFAHPGLPELSAIACGRVRVWERRPAHQDFATARVGRGSVPLATRLVLGGGEDPLGHRDHDLLAAAEALIADHQAVHDQPVLLDLRHHAVVSVVGPPERARAVARSVLMELATLCPPDDLVLAVCHSSESAGDWEFARWLPHAVDAEGTALRCGDGQVVLAGLSEEVGRRRERARRRTGSFLDRTAADELPQPQLLVVVDGYSASSPLTRVDVLQELTERAQDLAASLVFLVEAQRDEPSTVDVRLRVGDGGLFAAEDMNGNRQTGLLEERDPALCELLARRLAPLRLGEQDATAVLRDTCRLPDLLGLPSAGSLDAARRWSERAPDDLLRVPIGLGADGSPELLDVKEAAQSGMGPHGLIIGATGSGKSELLRTLVTALAVTHSPETLGFVLVDFKGGAAFAGLAELPQVAGMITNLADDLTMVDRVHSALFGEMQRRQTLLREAGNLDSVREHQARRAAGKLPGSQPLPYLLIVVDEFGELLANRPDFIDLFVAIGRVGRSLGMHLLLASQRLDEGRLRGLESHLSYRICLRTFSAAESHAVLGVNDAYQLPSVPGSAYLKVHTEIFDRFKAAFVSSPDASADEPVEAPAPRPVPARGLAVAAEPAEATPGRPERDHDRPTEMAVLVDRVRAAGARLVHQVWLPPLRPRIPLAELLPPLARANGRGLQSAGWPALGSLRVPAGVVDLPLEQSQRPFLVDFAGWAGHLAVVGAPQSGKSALLRTLVLALIATHTPDEVRFYGIDYGGGGLLSLAAAPHVGDVATRVVRDKVRRTISQVWSLVDERDAQLRELGIDSIEELRSRRAAGLVHPDLASDVFLVIDGWGGVRDEVEDLEFQLRDVAARGLRVGCHLVLTANRWQEIRPNLRDLISGRLELRLNDPGESEIDRRAAASLPRGVPGRAIAMDRNQLQFALPELGAPLRDVVTAAAAGWARDPAPAVRMLPARVTPADVAGAPVADGAVPVGVDEFELAPVAVDLGGADPHFLVIGDSESGKTTFLRSWLRGLQAQWGPDRAMFLVVDYRRTLLEAVDPGQLWAYCGAAPQAVAAVDELAAGIVGRYPPAGLSPQAIAARSWWTGPEFFVVVDDYDLVTSPSGNPLMPLLDLLAQGRDLGLHVVLARRAGGMARAGLDPIINRLRELHSAGLILSGDPTEGPILGLHRATSQPPGRGLLVRRRARALLVQTVDATDTAIPQMEEITA
jgi:S-DNA-T family DNA segregation ATPase FtsK/SpoIIIE